MQTHTEQQPLFKLSACVRVCVRVCAKSASTNANESERESEGVCVFGLACACVCMRVHRVS